MKTPAEPAEKSPIEQAFEAGAGALTALAAALPWPEASIAFRVMSAALGVASLLMHEGATPEETVAAIKRVRRIDTTEDDARVDLKLEEKRT